VQIRRFAHGHEQEWDSFCAEAHQATFLHTRRFLSYHGDRFRDCSLMLVDADGRTAGLFPAAIHPQDERCIVSHPGITYGGLIHRGGLRGEAMVEALDGIARYYAGEGAERLVYKPVPSVYHRVPAQDDLYALFRLGAARVRCDLSSAIDIERRLPVSKRRRRSFAKAQKAGVQVVEGLAYISPLWDVLEENLARKHGAQPVHTLDEIRLLAERFPDDIRCVCAQLDGQVVAGVLLFDTHTTRHAQYIASSARGYDVSALDAVFEACIGGAADAGKRWFSFGISTEEGGLVLNAGLYGFKSEFGGGGVAHDFYEFDLRTVSVG
jgi:hypothetical protein